MVEVARIFERGSVPVQLAQPQVNRGITVTDRAEVAFEVPDINRIKAHLWSYFSMQSNPQGWNVRWSRKGANQPR